MIRARPNFVQLLEASLRLAKDSQSIHILTRTWDALLGTPAQSYHDRCSLSEGVANLAKSSYKISSLEMLRHGLQLHNTEKSIVQRYGGLVPLLRIAGALLSADALITSLSEANQMEYIVGIIAAIMDVSADAMQGGAVQCTAMHDLLAAMALDAVTAAVSMKRILPVFVTNEAQTADGGLPLRVRLARLITLITLRHEEVYPVPPLSRLPIAVCRLYGSLQRLGGNLLVEAFQMDAIGEAGARAINRHLVTLARLAKFDTQSVGKHISKPFESGGQLQGARELLSGCVSSSEAHVQAMSYPVLPPDQSFQLINANIARLDSYGCTSSMAAAEKMIAGILSLPAATPEVLSQLPEHPPLSETSDASFYNSHNDELGEGKAMADTPKRGLPLMLKDGDSKLAGHDAGLVHTVLHSDDGRHLVAGETIHEGKVVVEYHGEITVDCQAFEKSLAK